MAARKCRPFVSRSRTTKRLNWSPIFEPKTSLFLRLLLLRHPRPPTDRAWFESCQLSCHVVPVSFEDSSHSLRATVGSLAFLLILAAPGGPTNSKRPVGPENRSEERRV